MIGWVAYALAWLAAATVWALAAASSARTSPASTFPFGALGMSAAALMGVGVWRLAGRLPWERRGARFYLVHGLCLALYAAGYTAAFFLPDIARGRVATAWTAATTS